MRNKRPKTEAVYYMKASQIENMVEERAKEMAERATRNVFLSLLYLPLMVLRDKYGFGKKRMAEFADYLLQACKDYEDDYFPIEEVERMIYEETGVRLVDR